jgi:hypothetical protein
MSKRNLLIGAAAVAALGLIAWHRGWFLRSSSKVAEQRVHKYGYTTDHTGIHYPAGYVYTQDVAVDTGRSCQVTGDAMCVNHALDMGHDYPEAIVRCQTKRGLKHELGYGTQTAKALFTPAVYENTYAPAQ